MQARREELLKSIMEERKKIQEQMSKIKHKIAIMSGKGGVGKSTLTVNLAFATRLRGYDVGVLDADIHGPSVPKILGVKGGILEVLEGEKAIIPVFGPMDMKVVSIEFLVPGEEVPIVWRGPLKSRAINEFLGEIRWGYLDFLYIDLPPGTGDEPLTVAQSIPDMDGVVIVTIPSEVSQIVVKKAVVFAKRLNLPIIGIVENMSGFICPHCGAEVDIFKVGGGEKIAKELNVPFLGKIPLDIALVNASDAGEPYLIKYHESKAAKAIMEIADKVIAFAERKSHSA